ncbi:two-component sensor histidine kinase (plasmid) [Paenibacillus rhizovicinus]|uniref:histidine kinase n=1 Tax=Paenibacillus rhizovicinus TaxID=2704463 RepID=A0A6C0PCV3_9BACL|nr:histidine kinase [Paenibacillus rhizovicinus]QHW35402.1 two-component sensor histidine kinase [Paenibacillus rhizovicinus]
MSYQRIKWMILYLSPMTIGVWEYVRHQFLLPYISMELGNFLTPFLAYLLSVTLLLKLFSVLENMQEQLNRERAAKIALEAGEQLARELHDGIAQSLFLLSVKLDSVDRKYGDHPVASDIVDLRKTVHEVNRYVRQAITNLRHTRAGEVMDQIRTIRGQINELTVELGLNVEMRWQLSESALSAKEQIELLSCLREAFLNINKHAEASKVVIESRGDASGWLCTVRDNGRGIQGDPFLLKDRFGLRIMKERAEEMNWMFSLASRQGDTSIEFRKEG